MTEEETIANYHTLFQHFLTAHGHGRLGTFAVIRAADAEVRAILVWDDATGVTPLKLAHAVVKQHADYAEIELSNQRGFASHAVAMEAFREEIENARVSPWQRMVQRFKDDDIRPELESGVPYCTARCPTFDGKRCLKLGYAPSGVCEPFVKGMILAMKEAR